MKHTPKDPQHPIPRQIDPEMPRPGAGSTPPRIIPVPANIKKPSPPAKPKEDAK